MRPREPPGAVSGGAPDPVAVCAAGEAAWHAAAYAGLGTKWRHDPGIGWSRTVPHRYLLAAVTLAPRPAIPAGLLERAPGVVRDCWAALRSEDLPGWTPEPDTPWMIRTPAPFDGAPVPGLTVDPTDDALLFEHTAFVAAGGAPPETAGELHPAGSHAWPGLMMLIARRNGRPAGTALAVRHPTGVFVAVVAAERRRGIGAALTVAAVRQAPELPATLTASVLGAGVYQWLGFSEITSPIRWHPPA